ncbi:MAG: T9SS type A sorting domain-containing protein [Bacteroidota bacterium]
MKKHLLVILTAVLLFNIRQANAQAVNFEFTITNTSSDTACDGQLNVQCTNPIAPLTYNWHDSNQGYVVGTGNSISGLCPGNYWLEIYNSYCQYYYFDVYLSSPSTAGPSFQMNATVDHSSNYNLSTYTVNQVSGGIGPYYAKFGSVNDSLPIYSGDSLNSISNLIFDSLNSSQNTDYYYFYVADSITYLGGYPYGNSIGFYFITSYDSTGSCSSYNNSLWVSAQGVGVTDSSLCDGYAYTEVYGGTPPYTYQFSSGSSDSTASGLCPGSYVVTVTDADSNAFSTSFVVGYPGTYYFSDGGSYAYLDTLYANAFQDCGIDYTMPIDSFYIDSSYALSNWEYVINWVIVQDTNEFLFAETYFIDSTGYYWFGLSLYCEARSSSFGSYTFLAGAHAVGSGFPTEVKELTADNSISVYPNPSNGIYQLKSSSQMKEYTVFDQLGRMVVNKRISTENETVNLSELNKGLYYLTVRFKDGTIGRQKLVKK